MRRSVQDIQRGDIFYCNLGTENRIGNEQRGNRPVIVIQNNVGNKFSATVIVVPITSSTTKPNIPTHFKLENVYAEVYYPSTVLCEQIYTISIDRLKNSRSGQYEYLDTLNRRDMEKLDECLKTSLDLIGGN